MIEKKDTPPEHPVVEQACAVMRRAYELGWISTRDGNVSVAIRYIEAWLRGLGAVAIDNLMEDAATAEISRSQVWQWIRSPKGVLDDGRKGFKRL